MENIPAEIILCIADQLPRKRLKYVSEDPVGMDLYHFARVSRRFWEVLRPVLYRFLKLGLPFPPDKRIPQNQTPTSCSASTTKLIEAYGTYARSLSLGLGIEHGGRAGQTRYSCKAVESSRDLLRGCKDLEYLRLWNDMIYDISFAPEMLQVLASAIRYNRRLTRLDLNMWGSLETAAERIALPEPPDLPVAARLERLSILCVRESISMLYKIMGTLGPAAESVTEVNIILGCFGFQLETDMPWRCLDQALVFPNLTSLTIAGERLIPEAISPLSFITFEAPSLRELTLKFDVFVLGYGAMEKTLNELSTRFPTIEILRFRFAPTFCNPNAHLDNFEVILADLAAKLPNLRKVMMQMPLNFGPEPPPRYFRINQHEGVKVVQRIDSKIC
ncbi:hypothetical protein TWF281_007489 [Arthrobotrys megalospora]